MRNDWLENICKLLGDYSEHRGDAYDQRRIALESAPRDVQAAVRLAIWDAIDEHVGGYPCDRCEQTVLETPVVNGQLCADCEADEVTVVTAAREDVRRVV